VRRLLIDTQALLWWLIDAPALSVTARSLMADPKNEALVSAASVWEIAIKRSLGKLSAGDDLLDTILGEGFTWLPVSAGHAWEVPNLPPHHHDPFDRLLIAQARLEDIPIVTGDPHFDAYDIAISW
jgi:PIN domain nuclease of toxin-antitoxin system